MILVINESRATLKIQPFAKNAADIARGITGEKGWLKYGNGFAFSPTEANIAFVRSQISSIELKDERASAVPAPSVERPRYVPKTTPKPWQEKALNLISAVRHSALFMVVGSGKTKVGIDRSGQLFLEGKITGVLVLAPKGVQRQWVEVAYPQHFGLPFKGAFWPETSRVIDGLGPQEKLVVFGMNWDAIIQDEGFNLAKAFIEAHKGKVLMIGDELHLLKGYHSKKKQTARHLHAKLLGDKCAFRLGMTGTPIARDLIDEWAELRWVDPYIIGIRIITEFRNEYCVMGGYEGNQVVGQKNIDRYRKKIANNVFSLTKEEMGGFPAFNTPWLFDLTDEQKALIKTIKMELKAIIDSTKFEIANAAVAVGKAQQVAGGFYYGEEYNHSLFANNVDNPRIQALLDIIETRSGDKIIIWVRFIEEFKIIMEVLGSEKAVMYRGSDAEKSRAKEQFISNPNKLYFVANPASAGTGLDGFQDVCSCDIFYSLADDFVKKEQAEGRIDRLGAKGSVSHFFLIGKGSFDSKIINRHKRKRQIYEMTHAEWTKFLDDDEDMELISDAAAWES